MKNENWPYKLDYYSNQILAESHRYIDGKWLNRDGEQSGIQGNNIFIPKNIVEFDNDFIPTKITTYSASGNVSRLQKHQINSGRMDAKLSFEDYKPNIVYTLMDKKYWGNRPRTVTEAPKIILAAENIVSLSGENRATRAVKRTIFSPLLDLFRAEPIMIAQDNVKHRTTAYYVNKKNIPETK